MARGIAALVGDARAKRCDEPVIVGTATLSGPRN